MGLFAAVDTGAALIAVLLFSDHLCCYNRYPLQSNQLAASPMLLFLLCWSRYVLFLFYVYWFLLFLYEYIKH